ncbi:MAG: tetratricopeptide repeat protein [Sulfurimicrobium sp.]|nr:tetratricopeptide repeat protein [Sulfurimicrobium sp.]
MILLHRLLLACLLVLLPFSAIAASSQDTEELIAQGQQALAAGQAAQAVLIFERIILDQPWRLGVWMDYALALQQTGDAESAQAIYLHLLTQKPPEYLRLWLGQQVQKGVPAATKWVSVGTATLLAGHDSNLNRAPAAGSLTLTYPFGSLDLPLTNNARAKAGSASLLNLNWEAARQTASGSDWSIQAGLSARDAPDTQGQNYLQPSLGLTRRWSGAAAEETLATLAYQQLQYGGQDLQRTLRAGLYHGQPWRAGQTNCSILYGAEWKSQTYPSAAAIDSQYLGMAASLGCTRAIGWNLLAHAGIDRAKNPRPGGDQQQLDLRAQIYGRLGSGQWQAEASVALLRDNEGYSPLLDNNRVRDIKRGALGLEYTHPLSGRLQGLARIEAYRQNSSLPLFDTQGNAAWLGLRYGFR